MLDQLHDWADEGRARDNLTLFHVHELYYQLSQKMPTMAKLPSRSMAKDRLEKEKYNYAYGEEEKP